MQLCWCHHTCEHVVFGGPGSCYAFPRNHLQQDLVSGMYSLLGFASMVSFPLLSNQAGEEDRIDYGELFDDERGWGALWRRPLPVYGPKIADEAMEDVL